MNLMTAARRLYAMNDKRDMDEMVKEREDSFEEYVALALLDKVIEVDDVEWTWDRGQRGGTTDPSWDPYVEEVTWKQPIRMTLGWEHFHTAGIEDRDLDVQEVYKKVVMRNHSLSLEDIIFKFGVLGEHPCSVTVKMSSVSHRGIDVMLTDIEPPVDNLEDAAKEYDGDRYDGDGY